MHITYAKNNRYFQPLALHKQESLVFWKIQPKKSGIFVISEGPLDPSAQLFAVATMPEKNEWYSTYIKIWLIDLDVNI